MLFDGRGYLIQMQEMSGLPRKDFETNLDHGGAAASSNTVQQYPSAPRFWRTRGYTVNSAEGYSQMNTNFALDDHDYASTQQSRDKPLHSLLQRQPVARKRSASYAAGDFSNDEKDDHSHSLSQTTGADKVVMTGWLHKMNRPKTSKATGHRKHRRFRLTAHSLEYDHLFQTEVQLSIINHTTSRASSYCMHAACVEGSPTERLP